MNIDKKIEEFEKEFREDLEKRSIFFYANVMDYFKQALIDTREEARREERVKTRQDIEKALLSGEIKLTKQGLKLTKK